MKEILLEDKGNLSALSSDVLQIIMHNSDYRKYIGKDSKVEIVRNIETAYKNLLSDECLFGVLRYGQDELYRLSARWRSEINTSSMEEWEYYIKKLSWQDRPNLQSTIKSESGLKTFVSNVAKFLTEQFNNKLTEKYKKQLETAKTAKQKEKIEKELGSQKLITKKEVMAKLSFQLIYKDAKRYELERKRNEERGNLRVADRGSSTYLNKKIHGSVYDSRRDSDYKSALKDRLKEFITSKLPQYDDPKDLPRDMKLLKDDTRFKLMGCPYRYDNYGSSNVSFIDLQKGETMYITFENEKRYDNDFNYYPRLVLFEIKMNPKTYQLEIINVLFDTVDEYQPHRQNLADISEFKTFVKEKQGLRI
jgi:hypothetical protein